MRSMSESEKRMKLLRIKLDDTLHARLKVQCAMDQVSMQQFSVDAIREALPGYNPQGNPRSNVQNQEAQ